MKTNRFALLAATAVVAFGMILTGCGTDKADNSSNSSTGSSSSSTSTSSSSNTASTGSEQVVKITADKDFKWTLDKTEVKKGQPVKLVITAAEGAGMHAVTIAGTDVKSVHAMSGKEETAIFTPDKAGDLTIQCSLQCGTGHRDMKTTLKVVD
jgi:cytochrome c oxidase subunit 2